MRWTKADITVLKEKKGVPTKIQVSGHVYALVHDDYANGRKGHK